jgi:hypothetical protein
LISCFGEYPVRGCLERGSLFLSELHLLLSFDFNLVASASFFSALASFFSASTPFFSALASSFLSIASVFRRRCRSGKEGLSRKNKNAKFPYSFS